MDDALKLDEVAKAAGVSPRTVRYYIQRGLLPQPRFRGPDTAYGEEHVVRLRAIRRLQDAYWPLEAIAGLFAGKSEDELRSIADGTTTPRGPASSRLVEPALFGADGATALPAPRGPTALAVTRVRRITLARGLVLELDEGAEPDVEALANRIVELVSPAPGKRSRGRR